MLEVFSGGATLTGVARKLGIEALTLDNDPRTTPDILVDILEWDYQSGRWGVLDYIHCSVPCQEFSICKTRGERNLHLARQIAGRTRAIIEHFLALNPRPVFTVESPRTSLLRHDESVKGWAWADCCYCCYGSAMKKPTRIWHNLPRLDLKMCSPTTCHWGGRKHPVSCQHAPPHMRAVIPSCLCLELLMSVCSALGTPLCARMPCPVRRPLRGAPPPPAPMQRKRGRPRANHSELSCSVCSVEDAFFYNLKRGPVMCARCYRRTRRQAKAAAS